MARVTCRRKPHKLARGRVLVALVAFHQRVRAHQREPVLVILNLGDIRLPALDRVAAFAVRPELTPVNVCVALGALGADLLEHHVGVALRASDLRVHTAQRITRRIVIELGVRSDGLPAYGGMTI